MKNKFTTSEGGIRFIKAFEGEVLKVYADPVGLWTLGVGHLLTREEKERLKLGQAITAEESTAFLRKDLQIAESVINEVVRVEINQNQFDALVSLAFNIGVKAFRGSSVLRYLNAGNTEKAADAFLLWTKAKGQVLAGLVRRRKAERTLFLYTKNLSVKPLTGTAQPDGSAAPLALPSSEPANDAQNQDTVGSWDLSNVDFDKAQSQFQQVSDVAQKPLLKRVMLTLIIKLTTGLTAIWEFGLSGKIALVLTGVLCTYLVGFVCYKYRAQIKAGLNNILSKFKKQ